MTDETLSSLAVVTDARAARVLVDVEAARDVAPFARRARSIADVARERGAPLDRFTHRVKRLARLGLLEVAEVTPRAGRPVRLYRTAAERFFVPHAVLPFEEVMASVERRYSARLIAAMALEDVTSPAAGGFGTCAYVDAAGEWRLHTTDRAGRPVDVRGGDRPAVFNAWTPLELTFEQAKAFQRDLEALLRRYSGGRGERYLLHLALAPERGTRLAAPGEAALPPRD